jgi:alpha-amylase/alpha-mannosidase (GH57 family)
MQTSIDKKITNYLGQLTDKQKKAVLSVVKTFAEEQEYIHEEYSNELKQELDNRYEAYKNGEPTVSEEEMEKRINLILNGKREK